MMHLLVGFMVFMGCGISLVAYLAASAPVGYEDEQGFHLGPEQPGHSPVLEGALPQPTH